MDHVVVLTRDLDAGTREAQRLGFTVKEGRAHANGLHNAHLKMSDGSSIELMSVSGAPGDRVATRYADMLQTGEGGVYVALAIDSLPAVLDALADHGIDARTEPGRAFSYVTFPRGSGSEHVFLVRMHGAVRDPPDVLRHANGADGIAAVWMDAPAGGLLEALGAIPCDAGARLRLGRVDLHVSPGPVGTRGRVHAVSLRGRTAPASTTLRGLDLLSWPPDKDAR